MEKILEKSGNFVSPEKWEPCVKGRRRHQKSKTGVSVAPQKGLMSSKFFFKKRQVTTQTILAHLFLKRLCLCSVYTTFFNVN